MENNNFNEDEISMEEFLQLARNQKIELIDKLAASMMVIGNEYATVAAEYYRQKFVDKDAANFAALTYACKKLEIRWDMIKHVVSALQSTLRAEREI